MFGWRGRAAEREHPGFVEEFFGLGIFLEEFGEATFLGGEFVVDWIAVGEMESLDETGLVGTLAFAGDVAAVASERF